MTRPSPSGAPVPSLDDVKGRPVAMSLAPPLGWERRDFVRRDAIVRRIAAEFHDMPGLVQRLEEEMRVAARNLDFETAARLRDELFDVRAAMDGKRREPRRQPARR